jgi:hypothetical protein
VLVTDTVTPTVTADQVKNAEKQVQALRSALKKRKGDSDETKDE